MNVNVEELNKLAVSIYHKNLSFLKDNFYDIYEDVKNLSHEIAVGNKKEQYTLEYVDGYFDILNHENNGMYYFTDSYKDAEERKKYVDFTNNNSLDLLRKNPYTNKLVSGEIYKDVMPIVNYINENVDLENVEYQKIYKFVFIGTGLGFHIQEIDSKIQSYTTLIIEPELEIFRLSLFTTDYSEFAKGNRTLFLSVGQDKNKRQIVYDDFSSHHQYMNYNVKYYNLVTSNAYIKDELVDFFAENSVITFPYKMVVDNLHKIVDFIKKKEKFISVPLAYEKKVLTGKKLLMISAGPSLDSYIEWIVENQNKFIIVSVDTMVSKLEKHKIIPDIIFSIDPSPRIALHLTTQDPNFLNNTAIIFLTQQDSGVFDIIGDKHYYFAQVLPLVESLGYLGSVPNVGTYAFLVSVHLGAEELYLIGNDAAFHQETGQNYATDCKNIIKHTLKESEDKNRVSNSDVLTVKGNFRETVKTNRELIIFIDHYKMAMRDLTHLNYKAYNLSDGAYIEGLEPLNYEEFNKKAQKFDDIKFSSIEAINNISVVVDNLEFKNNI